MTIEYTFTQVDGPTYHFVVNLDRGPLDEKEEKPAFWTELAFNQCTNCPLSTREHQYCPPATDLEHIIHSFKSILSFQSVTVKVITPERVISKECDMQTGLRSLIGLVMATSGCPILSKLKGMARSHLPFSNLEETIIRTAGAYLLKQYFVYKAGGKPDLDLKGLEQLYKSLQTVDGCFKRRIDAASERDANMNAIGSLGFMAMGVSFSLDDMLRELEGYSIPTH